MKQQSNTPGAARNYSFERRAGWKSISRSLDVRVPSSCGASELTPYWRCGAHGQSHLSVAGGWPTAAPYRNMLPTFISTRARESD